MKILIVEDNLQKRTQLSDFFQRNFPNSQLEHRFSYNSGLREILTNVYHLVLLDMTLPNYDISKVETGGDNIPFAGELIMEQLDRRGILTKVIVVTMFESFVDGTRLPDLDKRIRKNFPLIYLGHVYFNLKNTDWEKQLHHLLTKELIND